MDDGFIHALSFVKSSLYRKKILKSLSSGIRTPSEIAKDNGIRLNYVSMYLAELKKEGLVQCLNEDAKKGRLYEITEFGNEILKMIMWGNNGE